MKLLDTLSLNFKHESISFTMVELKCKNFPFAFTFEILLHLSILIKIFFYVIRFISALLHTIICSFNSQMMEFLMQSNSPHFSTILIMDTQALRKNCDSWHNVAHRRNDTCFSTPD